MPALVRGRRLARTMIHTVRTPRPHVVIAGGGIAAVEAMLALRDLAGARVTIELIAPEDDLVLRPLTVATPFGGGEPRRHSLTDICADQDAVLRRDAVEFVDVVARTLETTTGASVAYDALVLAVGAHRRAALPGALTFDGPQGVEGLRALIAELDSGAVRSAAFVVPDGVSWPLPLYELALLTAWRTRARDVALTLVTPEPEPLDVFGDAARTRVRALLADKGIALRAGVRPLRIANRMLLTSGGAIPAERLVALPALEGPRVAGVPCDRNGFLVTDEHGAVEGAAGVYAAGDGTDSPIKQGGLAAQQADAAAAAIAASVGAPCDPMPFRPQLRAQLLTGSMPLWLRGGREEDVASVAGDAPLWSPASKVAARYLTPYLASRTHLHLGEERVLRDVEPTSGDTPGDRAAALEIALALADDEAASGEPAHALRWLDAAEGLAGMLPAEYAEKRRRWSSAPDPDRPRIRELGGAWS